MKRAEVNSSERDESSSAASLCIPQGSKRYIGGKTHIAGAIPTFSAGRNARCRFSYELGIILSTPINILQNNKMNNVSRLRKDAHRGLP
jgi:hypothetical protein